MHRKVRFKTEALQIKDTLHKNLVYSLTTHHLKPLKHNRTCANRQKYKYYILKDYIRPTSEALQGFRDVTRVPNPQPFPTST